MDKYNRGRPCSIKLFFENLKSSAQNRTNGFRYDIWKSFGYRVRGCRCIYLQNERNLSVLGLDSSPAAIKVAAERGLLQKINQSIFDFHGETFDTLLLLMNGVGICGSLERLELLMEKLKSLMNPGGQVFMDSSDLIYLFDESPNWRKNHTRFPILW